MESFSLVPLPQIAKTLSCFLGKDQEEGKIDMREQILATGRLGGK